MRFFVNVLAGTAIVTAAGIVVTWIGPKHAVAQQKPPATPQLVRNVDEPGFNTFQTSHNTFFGVNTVSINESLAVPPVNKVAVIEHVSASGALSLGAIPRGFLRCSNGTQEVNHSLVFTAQGSTATLTAWATSQPIKCYATTATSTSGGLFIHIEANAFQTLQPSWVVAASGYLVPQ
jgi:hypothetical protein